MKNYNVIRKKVEMLHQFNKCESVQDFELFNNSVVLPLYNEIKAEIKARCESENFEPATIGNFYFSNFNFLHDAVYFLENMHYDILSEISHSNFVKNGWCVL